MKNDVIRDQKDSTLIFFDTLWLMYETNKIKDAKSLIKCTITYWNTWNNNVNICSQISMSIILIRIINVRQRTYMYTIIPCKVKITLDCKT